VSGVDGLGCTGSGAHSLSETMDLKTFKNLTRRAALFIYRLTQEK
jgi:glutamate carboxypeptidase